MSPTASTLEMRRIIVNDFNKLVDNEEDEIRVFVPNKKRNIHKLMTNDRATSTEITTRQTSKNYPKKIRLPYQMLVGGFRSQ
jgi:hypothetical protein